MKRFIFGIVFSIALIQLYPQSERIQSIHSAKMTLFGLSYSYELALGHESSLNFELMLASAFGSDILYGDYWLVAPVLRIEPRLYYNYVKRTIKEKKVINNAANYFSLSTDYQAGIGIGQNAASNANLSVVLKWGIHRAIGRHFFFEGAVGPGAMATSPDDWTPYIGIDLKLGYVFNARNKSDDKN